VLGAVLTDITLQQGQTMARSVSGTSSPRLSGTFFSDRYVDRVILMILISAVQMFEISSTLRHSATTDLSLQKGQTTDRSVSWTSTLHFQVTQMQLRDGRHITSWNHLELSNRWHITTWNHLELIHHVTLFVYSCNVISFLIINQTETSFQQLLEWCC